MNPCLPGASCLVPPWCLPGCPIGLFLPPRLSNWSFPTCLPGASLVPPWLSSWSFLAFLTCQVWGLPLLPPGDSLGGRKGSIGQPGRHQGGRKRSIGQSARHQGGTREAGKNHLDSLGGAREAGKDQLDSLGGTRGTRETCSTALPIESRFWKSAGFCLTFNTISMANGPVRGKSWGVPRPAAQHRLNSH